MAASLLNLTAILSLLIIPSLLALPRVALSDDEEYYVLDIAPQNFRSRSRFLASKGSVIKKGTHCQSDANNICNGVSANNGTSLLYCCKTHCRNVLRDENNCGRCGNKCRFGFACCNGSCINTGYSAYNCGECGNKCPPGIKCEYGLCEYA